MDEKRIALAAVVLGGFLMFGSVLMASDPAEIDKVRSKSVLDNEDLQTIDTFVRQSLEELVKSTDFTSVSKIRAGVVSRANSSAGTSSAQYSQQFLESVRKHLANGFDQASNLPSDELKFRAMLNLLILADELANVRLADLAIKYIDSPNQAVRYWAVRCVTNPAVVKQLKQTNPSDDSKLAAQILERFKAIVDTAGPETLPHIAKFADKMENPQADALLEQIADMRIKKYADGTVKDEIMDLTILEALCDKISADRNNQDFGSRFGQLYSYAIQRYIADIKGGDFLSAEEKDQLATVLVETEKSYLSKFLGIQQTTIKKAVEANDYVALWQEHNRLLGDEAKTGELPTRLKFDYGDKRIYPVMLASQPGAKSADEK